MTNSFNSLLAAWAITLIVLVSSVLYIELSFTPAADIANPADAADTSEKAAKQGPEAAQLAELNDTSSDDQTSGDLSRAAGSDTKVTRLPRPTSDTTTTPTTNTTIDNGSAPGEVTRNGEVIQAAGPSQITQTQTQATQSQATQASGFLAPSSPGTNVTAIRSPLSDLIEQTNSGPLPRISLTGLKSSDYYAAPVIPDGDDRPRIALLISELGQRKSTTERAITTLPPEVSIAFSPYSSKLEEWTGMARQFGHEYFMMVPMEPVNFPQNDPGPLSLFVDQTVGQNISLLQSTMGQTTGYVGLVNHMGSRFTAASDSLRPVLEEIHRRGLVFVDGRSSRFSRAGSMAKTLGMSVAVNDRFIDNALTEDEILKQLNQLEIKARTVGAALGLARPYPVTIRVINTWRQQLEERGFQLVPVTAIIGRQPIR